MIDTALRLSAPDIEALLEGRTIAVIPRIFIEPGRQFALYPCDASINPLPAEQHYRSDFLPIAKTALAQLSYEAVKIKAWAKCELCQVLNDAESLAALSQLTLWTTKGLQEILAQRGNIFLTYLRVYQLPVPVPMSVYSKKNFIPLSNPQTFEASEPVLRDRIFAQRRHQLENRLPPPHPELEELQGALAQLDNPATQQLNYKIKQFLGWASTPTHQHKPDLSWVNTIADLGNRSTEQDTDKSNYQAGTDFENIVRDSLEFLGFTVDYAHKGGAGGLDLFCSKPYPLVGECKAGKKIPNDTAVQLWNLGTLRLKNLELLKKTAKLIIGPGKPTAQLEDAAKVHGMAIINPETLEKLVKLESLYPHSVDLFKLKDYLKPGQSDDEVGKYINKVYNEIKLRSHLVELVKKHLENTKFEQAGVEGLHGAYAHSNPPTPLQPQELYEILIELSSPLTGYLGRNKGVDWQNDRFYFLRDLPLIK